MEATQNMFGPSGALSAGSILKSVGIHVFTIGLLLLLPAQALLENRTYEKEVDIDIVFYRPKVAPAAAPVPVPPAPAVKIAAAPKPAAPAPAAKPAPSPAPGKPEPAPQPVARVEAPPQPPVAKTGILAFKDQFANVSQNKSAPRLGADARYVATAAASEAGQPATRSSLTNGSPGSSGGINTASLNRSVGGGGGGNGTGGIPGVSSGRATSSIATIASADERPKPQNEPARSRTDEEIQIVFDRYKASFYRLYNRALRNDPALKGQIVLRLTIEPDGSVSTCKVQSSDMKAPDLADQILNITRTINFGAKGAQAVTITYPIDFLPAA